MTGVKLSNELCLVLRLFLRGGEVIAGVVDSGTAAFLETTIEEDLCFSLAMYGNYKTNNYYENLSLVT